MQSYFWHLIIRKGLWSSQFHCLSELVTEDFDFDNVSVSCVTCCVVDGAQQAGWVTHSYCIMLAPQLTPRTYLTEML